MTTLTSHQGHPSRPHAAARGGPRGWLHALQQRLRGAVQAQLQSFAGESGDHRVSALLRLLRGAASAGSDRQVILAWAEAMADWYALDVHAYVDDRRGHFIHEAAGPGADASAVPRVIDASSLEDVSRPTPLSASDRDRLHVTAAGDVVSCRVGTRRGWLLIVCGTPPPGSGPSLPVCVGLLEDFMAYGTLASLGRTSDAVVACLFGADERASRQAELAMDALCQSLGFTVAALSVRSAAGAPLITVGDWQSTAGNASNPGSRVVVLRHAVDRYSLALGIATQDGRPVTPQEAAVAEKAADLLQLWAQRLVRRAKDAPERRADPRRFDEVVDALALQALEHGVPVTALVVSLRGGPFAALGPECAARLRQGLRASDLVGMLSDGEIGVLLHNTSEGGGRLVETRVHQILETVDPAAGPTGGVVVGLAARMPRQLAASPVLTEARARAARPIAMAASR